MIWGYTFVCPLDILKLWELWVMSTKYSIIAIFNSQMVLGRYHLPLPHILSTFNLFLIC